MKGREITALFSGATVEGHHEIHGYDFRSYYDPSGTFRSYQDAAATPRKAKWWVKGDKICVHWEDETPPGDLCRHMKTDGKGNYWKVKTTRDKGEVLNVRFKSFSKGNPDQL